LECHGCQTTQLNAAVQCLAPLPDSFASTSVAAAVSQARVNVPDDRFNWLVNTYKPKSAVSAYLDICDIAGLVK
jgi:obg-like ATPase 1